MTNINSTPSQKIFFSDLDGTLLNSQKTIGEETRKTLHQILEQNHYLVLSSGRPLQSIIQVKKELNLPDQHVYLIGFNGGIIYDCEADQIIFEHRIDLDLVLPIFQLAKNQDLHCQTYNESHIICKKSTPELENYASIVKLPVIFTENILEYLQKGPFKILSMSQFGPSKLDPLRKIIEEQFAGVLETLYSAEHLLEVFPVNSGKGTALTILTKHLELPIENTIAAGDQENDLSMLLAAGTSVAMCNGTDSVKASASFVTKRNNNEDGLVPYLKEFFNL